MAHELVAGGLENRIEAAFALTAGWHGLGTVLDNVPNAEAMIEAAGLDWTVSMRELFDANGHKMEDGVGTYRDDTNKSLGTVSGKYQLVQNRAAFAFLDSLIMDGVMKYESAGAIRGGRLVWVLGRMPSVDQIATGDDCNRYVLFTTSHDGSACLHAIPTSVRVVCANTYRAAIAGHKGMRHIGDMDAKLQIAREYVSQFDRAFTLYRDNARRLAEVQCADKVADYIEILYPETKEDGRAKTNRENKVVKIRANYENDRQSLPAIRGTWWALYNSVSEMIDHQSTFRGEGRERRENRMISTLNGEGADFKNKAFDLAVEMSGIGNKLTMTV